MERRDASAAAGRTAAKGPARAGARWAAALALAGLALTGCGAGQEAQTSEKAPAVDGVHIDAGPLALRDLHVGFGEPGGYPAGGAAPLRVWIANDGDETIVLEGVTSPAAEVVTLVNPEGATGPTEIPPGAAPATPDGDPAEPTEEPAGEGDATAGPDAGASGTPGASPTAGGETASPTAEPDETAAQQSGERDFAIEIAPGAEVNLTPEAGSFLLLEGLKEDLTAAMDTEVVFVFSNGETVTAQLPMGEPDDAQPRTHFEPPHDEHAE